MSLFPPRTEPSVSPFQLHVKTAQLSSADVIGDRSLCGLTPYLESLGVSVRQILERDPSTHALKDPRFLQFREGAHEILILGQEFSDPATFPLDSLNRMAGMILRGLRPRVGLCILARPETEPSLEVLSLMRQSGFRALTLLTSPEPTHAIRYQIYQRV